MMESQPSRNSLPRRIDKTSTHITSRCQQSIVKSRPAWGIGKDLRKKVLYVLC